MPLIIAIDGPSASGKSTLGRMLARELNLLYIDTGSMYRAVALAVLESSISANDDVAVGSLAARVDIDLQGDPDSLRVTLGGLDVTDQIRSEEITHLSSIISTIPAVRRAMVARQRELGLRGAVLNGRDIGTVVFPDADIKFFLTALPQARAERHQAMDSHTRTRPVGGRALSARRHRGRTRDHVGRRARGALGEVEAVGGEREVADPGPCRKPLDQCRQVAPQQRVRDVPHGRDDRAVGHERAHHELDAELVIAFARASM